MNELSTYSRSQIEQGSKSFALAARLFEPGVRADAYLLYTWCRYCDDLIDGQQLGHESATAAGVRDVRLLVAELEVKTRGALAGQADEAAFQCLAAVCRKHEIPERYPLELIAGFRMDAEGRAYETISDTLEYGYHVAGVVGVMMSIIMGARGPETLNHAADLGIAFQLTNIARDVIADHRQGRVYVPGDWLHEAGLDRDTMAARDNRQALYGVTERLLVTADAYYASARAGLSQLPLRSAWAVASAQKIYAAIGEDVRRRGAAAWDQRVSTTRLTKVTCIAQSSVAALASRGTRKAVNGQTRDGLWTMKHS